MDALAHLRELFGSQRAIADACSVSVSTVSMWRESFPLERRLQLLELCRQRGYEVDARLVLGEFADEVAELAEKVAKAMRPRLGAAA